GFGGGRLSVKSDREEGGVDLVQVGWPHSVDGIKAAGAAVEGPFSFMKGKLGRHLDLGEHLALGVTIAWYPGFTHHVTWAALWDDDARRLHERFGFIGSPSDPVFVLIKKRRRIAGGKSRAGGLSTIKFGFCSFA